MYVNYAKTNSDNYVNTELVDPGFVPELSAGIAEILSFYRASQHTWSVGWRWNISENMAIKLQFDRTQIDDNGSTVWVNRAETIDGYPSETVNTVFANISFIF
jgi:hypothetical protein